MLFLSEERAAELACVRCSRRYAIALVSVLDSTGRKLLLNTYGPFGEVTSQTLADGRKLRYDYGFDDRQRTSEVIFTDDHGYVTTWMLGRDGFYGSLPTLATH